MTAGDWIGLGALLLTLLIAIIGAALYIGRVVGSLPGMVDGKVRAHEDRCLNFERHTSPHIRPVGQPEEAAR